MPDLFQQVHFHNVRDGSLASVLNLPDPLGVDPSEALRQLSYVERYATQLGCNSFVVEDHYIDKDYMEEHSVFYSKSLYPYENYCRRVHFFKPKSPTIEEEIAKLQAEVSDQEAFRAACQRFSENQYLGFTVIKPLPG